MQLFNFIPGLRNLDNKKSLLILCIVLFLTFLDNTIVSVALSSIQSSLSAGVQDMQWIVDGYMLVFAVFMLSGGTLGDIIGRKKVLLSGIILFIGGSLMAFFARDVNLLIAGRVVMGIGAAASEPGTLSIIRHLYKDKKTLSHALGIWAAVSGIALAFGPIIGGIIVGFNSYRGIFMFNIILGVIALALGYFFLPESSDPKGRSFDIIGLILGGITVSSTIFGLIVGETAGYKSWWIALLFCISLLSLVGFIINEGRVADPVLPLKYFKRLQFSFANIVAFSVNFGIFSVFFFVALYLQLIAGFSGYQIALSFLAMTLAIVIASLLAGKLNGSHKTSLLMIGGSLLSGIGIFLIRTVISPKISVLDLTWVLAISGFGFGICLVTMTSSVLHIVPPKRSGMAASVVNTSRELGGVFGVAILGSIVNGQLTSNLLMQLKKIGLPANFQSFAVYAITHGGNTPKGVNISPSILINHANLINEVTKAAYQAFANGLNTALSIASGLLILTGLIYGSIYIVKRRSFNDRLLLIKDTK